MESEPDNTTLPPFYEARADLETVQWLSTRLQTNRRLSDSVFYPLLVAYAITILFGVLANVLIISLILRQRSRSCPRAFLMIEYLLNSFAEQNPGTSCVTC